MRHPKFIRYLGCIGFVARPFCCGSYFGALRKDIYNDKLVKYWYEEETSASMLASEKLEYKDKTQIDAGVEIDDDGYVRMGSGMEFDMNFESFGPNMPGSSSDAPMAPLGKGAGKGVLTYLSY